MGVQQEAVTEEYHRKMVLRKKAKKGGGYGSATPTRPNRIRTASEVSCEQKIYVTSKVDIMPGADTPTELRMGYHKFLSMLKESNDTCVSLPVSPLNTENAIVELEDILTKMSVPMRQFRETLKIRDTCSVCATARLGFDSNFEMMMKHTYYDLCAAKILLMKKCLQLPFNEMICYLQFAKNTIDTDSLQKLIHGDMENINPEAEHNWFLYGKVSWEGYLKKKFKNKKEEF